MEYSKTKWMKKTLKKFQIHFNCLLSTTTNAHEYQHDHILFLLRYLITSHPEYAAYMEWDNGCDTKQTLIHVVHGENSRAVPNEVNEEGVPNVKRKRGWQFLLTLNQ